MMSKKEILKKIKELKERREWLYNPRTDPDVEKLYEAYDNLAEVVRKDREPEIDRTYRQQSELEKLLAEASRKKYEPSDKLKLCLKNLYRGIVTGKPSIYWASEDERFLIVHQAPTTSWGGIGQSPVYCQAEYYIVDIESLGSYLAFRERAAVPHLATVMDIHKIHQVKGRLSKAEFDNWVKETEEIRKNERKELV